MIIQWAHLQKNKPTQSKRRTKVFIAEPDPTLRQHYGRLFGILELDSLRPSHLRFLHVLIEDLERVYYPQSSPSSTTSIPAHFESVLQKMNLRVPRLLERFNVELDAKRFQFLVGVLNNRDIAFAYQGQMHALLLHRGETMQQAKLADVIQGNGEEKRAEKKGEQKLFTTVLEGKLGEQDTLLLTTETLLDYLSKKQIQDILVKHTAKGGVERLEALLDEAPTHLTFPLLVIQLQPEPNAQQSSHASLTRLRETEHSTERLLTPSIRSDISSMINTAKNFVFRWKHPQHENEDETTPNQDEQRTWQESAVRATEITLKATYALLRMLGKFLLHFTVTFTILSAKAIRWFMHMLIGIRKKEEGARLPLPPAAKALSRASETMAHITERLRILPLKSRTSLIIGSTLLIVFLGSMGVLFIQRRAVRIDAAFQAQVKTITEKQSQAEASLIYRDEEKAKQYIEEAATLLAALPQRSAVHRTKKQELEKEIQTIRGRLQKMISIASPEIFADLTQHAPPQQSIDVQALVLQDGGLYSYGNGNLIFKTNQDNAQTVSFELPKENIDHIRAATANSAGTVFFVDTQNRLIELNPKERTLRPVDITFAEGSPDIRAAAMYNDRLYLVDANQKQIFRHTAIDQGFAKGTSWLKEDLILADTQDMVIDGSIWLLFTDGTITRLAQGNRESFTVASIDPALQRATQITTTFESDSLYLLDPQDKRIIVLSKKDGKLMMQYQSPAFSDLKDFIVDEKQKTLYVLNGSTIYKVTLEHL